MKESASGEEEARLHPGYTIQTDQPHYGQIPQALLKDPNAPHPAVRLYGVLHTWEGEKRLDKRMFRSVTQEQLGRDMGIHRNQVRHWMRWLEKEGWIEIRPQGLNKPHIIVLFGRKQK